MAKKYKYKLPANQHPYMLFPIRRDWDVGIYGLPKDVTPAEMDRVIKMLTALVFTKPARTRKTAKGGGKR